MINGHSALAGGTMWDTLMPRSEWRQHKPQASQQSANKHLKHWLHKSLFSLAYSIVLFQTLKETVHQKWKFCHRLIPIANPYYCLSSVEHKRRYFNECSRCSFTDYSVHILSSSNEDYTVQPLKSSKAAVLNHYRETSKGASRWLV